MKSKKIIPVVILTFCLAVFASVMTLRTMAEADARAKGGLIRSREAMDQFEQYAEGTGSGGNAHARTVPEASVSGKLSVDGVPFRNGSEQLQREESDA